MTWQIEGYENMTREQADRALRVKNVDDARAFIEGFLALEGDMDDLKLGLRWVFVQEETSFKQIAIFANLIAGRLTDPSQS